MGEATKPNLIILYGSASGTAEETAERVAREALSFGLTPVLSSMDSYLSTWTSLISSGTPVTVCFLCSTTGQGDFPDNMQQFWKCLLKKSLKPDCLANLQFTVLGLGDSSYAKYNFVGKKFCKRLLQLGGSPLTELHLADDQHELGPDAVIGPWLNKLWLKLFPNSTVDESGYIIMSKPGMEPKFFIHDSRTGPNVTGLSESFTSLTVDGDNFKKIKLIKSERVTEQDHFQDVHLFTFDMSASPMTYSPGDVLVVQPINLEESVTLFYEIFPKLKPRRADMFYVIPNPKRPWAQIPCQFSQLYPQPWSLEFIVTHYFDLQVVPKMHVFELLAHFTTNELEKEKLEEFCTTAGQQDLWTYCNRPRRTVLEVLQDFQHAVENITEDYLFDLFTPIKPRSFSIASSMRQAANEVQILVAVIEYKTKLKKPRLGLCSNFLKRLFVGDYIHARVQQGSFQFPSDKDIPLIMVGPGTGCAPFRSMIAEKHGVASDLVLFFGCRNEAKDYFFKKEWTTMYDQKELQLYVAFSRDSANGGKVYVQHLIPKAGFLLWNLIDQKGGMIFVAGNAKVMPVEVRNAFIEIFKKNGVGENATAYMDQLIKIKRYQTEVWS